MKAGKITAKLRDAVPVRFMADGKEIKMYKNIEIPDALKELEIMDFRFDADGDKITFQLFFDKGILPEVMPPERPKVTRADKAAAKATITPATNAAGDTKTVTSAPDTKTTITIPVQPTTPISPAKSITPRMATPNNKPAQDTKPPTMPTKIPATPLKPAPAEKPAKPAPAKKDPEPRKTADKK